MSDEAKIDSVAAPESAENVPAREAGVEIEVKDVKATTNPNGVTSEVEKESAATDVKDTNGTSEVATKEPVSTNEEQEAETEEATMADIQPTENSAAPGSATPASAKSKSRRKSSGIPEHKSKKSNKKGVKTSNSHIDAKPGDYFFIRLKGYPLWPGIVCSEDMLPSTLINTRPVTAARADGTYREDYQDGGKKVLDRTFPVMYLSTQEFSWSPNFDLIDIDLDNLTGPDGKANKNLTHAYQLAAEKHDLQHWKDILIEFQLAREAEANAKAAKAAEKLAAKSAGKGKRKSKTAVDADEDADGDAEMVDAPPADAEEGGEKKPKSSKKRKATTEAEESVDTPARTDSVKKLKLKVNSSTPKTPNGNATPKSTAKKDQSAAKSSKSKSKKAANGTAEVVASPVEPELSPEEKLAKKEKEIMFLRHKLQKGLLTRDAQPKEEEMKQMSDYITKLEEHANLEVSIMKATKINKVLKAILKLDSIPKEEQFKFKDRSQSLLNEWNKILGTDQPSVGTPSAADKPAKELSNGISTAKPNEKSTEPEAKAGGKSVESTAVAGKAASEPANEELVAESNPITAGDAAKPSVSESAIEAAT